MFHYIMCHATWIQKHPVLSKLFQSWHLNLASGARFGDCIGIDDYTRIPQNSQLHCDPWSHQWLEVTLASACKIFQISLHLKTSLLELQVRLVLSSCLQFLTLSIRSKQMSLTKNSWKGLYGLSETANFSAEEQGWSTGEKGAWPSHSHPDSPCLHGSTVCMPNIVLNSPWWMWLL